VWRLLDRKRLPTPSSMGTVLHDEFEVEDELAVSAMRRWNPRWLGFAVLGLLGIAAWYFLPYHGPTGRDGRTSGLESDGLPTEPALGGSPELEPVFRQARSVAATLVERFPDDPRALHLAGQLHYQLGETPAAIQFWQQCLQYDPASVDARIAIGMLQFESGEFAEAEQMLLPAFLQAPAHPQGGYLLASSLLNQGKLDQAEEVLLAALSIQSQSVATQVLLGQVLLQKKQPAEAKACFLAASRLAPDHANVWFGLASACAQLGEREEAARHRATFQQLQRQQLRDEIELTKDYDDRLALTQDLAAIYAAAGRLYHEQGDEAGAERHWQSALKLDQGSMEARVELARLYQRQNRPKQALASWLPLQAIRSEDVGFWLYLGQLYAQLDDFPQADEAFRRVIELAPDSAPGYAARAELRIQTQREADQAVRWARQAVERQASADHYFLLSVASRQHGDLAAAREAAERAVRLQPDHPQYRQWFFTLQAER
jgi:tetratricopeptide (TPR) repeat protein